MTGYPESNFPAFRAATEYLRGLGIDVVSPHEINPHTDGIDHPWRWYLKRDIVELVTVEAIVMLPGWQKSKGAQLERHIAETLEMRAYNLADFDGLPAPGMGPDGPFVDVFGGPMDDRGLGFGGYPGSGLSELEGEAR